MRDCDTKRTVISKVIKVNSVTDIQAFARMASQVDGDVLIKKGKFVIDGKSLMGLFSIDMSNGVTVEYPEGNDFFDVFIGQYKA